MELIPYRTLAVLLIIAIFSYGLTSILVYFFQDKFIYQRSALASSFEYDFETDFTEYWLRTKDNVDLNVLHFKTAIEAKKGVIIYFHGNAGNLSRWGQYAPDFCKHGYDLIIMDYRGYGKSTGKPGEDALYADAKLIWNWAKENFTYDKWILSGRSIGSAVASRLANKTDPDLLCLETPFDDINGAGGAILVPFKLKYQFSNYNHLKSVKCDVYIIYGSNDLIVPERSTLRLMSVLKENDKMIKIEGGKHNNLRDFDKYHSTIQRILVN